MPRSPEVGVALSLLGAFVVLRMLGPVIGRTFVDGTAQMLASSTTADPTAVVGTARDMLIVGLGPVLAVGAVLAVIGGVAQVGFVYAPKAARPKLSNLALKRGVEKFKPQTALAELVKTVGKVALLALVMWGPLQALFGEASTLHPLRTWLGMVDGLIGTVLVRALALSVVLAAADLAWSRYRTAKSQRMSKQDVRDEHKLSDGDPMIRQRRMSKAREMSRNRMIGSVAQADVVIVNPVRFAVALAYTDGDPAPRVVAKGSNRMARRIRTEAYRHGVPVTQDVALARALFRRCQVGQFVPAALFEAVAVVLAAVYRRRWQRTGARVAS